LVCVFVSQPVDAVLSQLPKPALQLAMVQVPEAHPALALRRLQAALQAPQFCTLVERFTSQPLLALPSQFSNPAWQVPSLQPPFWHSGRVFAAGAQGCPQALQLFGSLASWDSQPSFGS
jgi:hypothetical protein